MLLRFSNYFASVGAGFDGGWGFEDVDVAVITAPTLASKDDADAAVRLAIADWRHYITHRKPRIGEDVVLMVDEFGAVQARPGWRST